MKMRTKIAAAMSALLMLTATPASASHTSTSMSHWKSSDRTAMRVQDTSGRQFDLYRGNWASNITYLHVPTYCRAQRHHNTWPYGVAWSSSYNAGWIPARVYNNTWPLYSLDCWR